MTGGYCNAAVGRNWFSAWYILPDNFLSGKSHSGFGSCVLERRAQLSRSVMSGSWNLQGGLLRSSADAQPGWLSRSGAVRASVPHPEPRSPQPPPLPPPPPGTKLPRRAPPTAVPASSLAGSPPAIPPPGSGAAPWRALVGLIVMTVRAAIGLQAPGVGGARPSGGAGGRRAVRRRVVGDAGAASC